MKRFLFLTVFCLSLPLRLFAAVGCDLNDPDRDVKRLFPGSTGFKTRYVAIDKKGGNELLSRIEARLGEKFQGLYETADVPYTIYDILKGTEKIGFIHGVNQKATYGGMQVFLALDENGVIRAFYFQKLTSKAAKELRSAQFGRQFEGLSLKDFYEGTKIKQILNPAPEAAQDFKTALRAAKKNLILMDEFVFENRHLPYFKP